MRMDEYYYSGEETERYLASVLLVAAAICVLTKRVQQPSAPPSQTPRRRKRIWSREWLTRRSLHGDYHQLLEELDKEDTRGVQKLHEDQTRSIFRDFGKANAKDKKFIDGNETSSVSGLETGSNPPLSGNRQFLHKSAVWCHLQICASSVPSHHRHLQESNNLLYPL